MYHSEKKGLLLVHLWEALLAPQHQRARGLRTRSANRQAAWERGRVVGFRCAGSTAGNFRMERAATSGDCCGVSFRLGKDGHILELQIPLKPDGKPMY